MGLKNFKRDSEIQLCDMGELPQRSLERSPGQKRFRHIEAQEKCLVATIWFFLSNQNVLVNQ